jgi:uncharacterized protein
VFGSGLIRTILLAVAVWFLYRVVKRWSQEKRQNTVSGQQKTAAPEGSGEVLDIMVQDPNCGTYLPKGQALRVRLDGAEYHFCSEKCRDEFRRKKKAGAKASGAK